MLQSLIPEGADPSLEASAQRDVAAIYERHLRLMLWIARRRFRIPEPEAEPLVHEVFVNFLSKAGTIEDVKAWLVAGISNACRYYLRLRDRCEPLPEDIAERPDPQFTRVLDMWPDQLAARQAIASTTARCQLVLRLRYFEGYSVPEIAKELRITNAYATKLLGECLKQAQRRYSSMVANSGVGA